MIRKILVAVGGTVAVRLLTGFKRAGVKTVAIYTMQDSGSNLVGLADEAICIGDTLECYHSRWERIITAAEISEVEAIHPGDGPLAAHERFAEVCGEVVCSCLDGMLPSPP